MKNPWFLGVFLAMAACSPTAGGGDGTPFTADAGNGGGNDTGDNTQTDTGNPTGTDVPVTRRDAGTGAMDACTATVARGAENTDALCANGVDDDCNGYTDCDDHACSGTATVTVCGTAHSDSGTTTHTDGSGGRADTAGCVRAGYEDTAAACSDGIDNDCNGYTDCNDRNCSCVGSCGAWAHGCTCHGTEITNAACMDGIDNNCNGYTDCADFGCSHNTHVTVCASDAAVPPG